MDEANYAAIVDTLKPADLVEIELEKPTASFARRLGYFFEHSHRPFGITISNQAFVPSTNSVIATADMKRLVVPKVKEVVTANIEDRVRGLKKGQVITVAHNQGWAQAGYFALYDTNENKQVYFRTLMKADGEIPGPFFTSQVPSIAALLIYEHG